MESIIEQLRIVVEKITPEERKVYTEYGKRLKKALMKELGISLRVKVMSSARPDPFISVNIMDFRDASQTIPNEFRLKVAKKLGDSVNRPENVDYGNVRPHSVSLQHSDWLKVMGKL